MNLTPNQMAFLRDYMRQAAGVQIDESKDYLLSSRLRSVMIDHDIDAFETLIDHLRRRDSVLHQATIDALTTHETSFFRDTSPFRALREVVVPERLEANNQRSFTMWSAACSTGQELYSAAIMVREHFPAMLESGFTLRLWGSDISAGSVEQARLGRFTQIEINRGLPARLLRKYFKRQDNRWEAGADLRQMIRFEVMNLSQSWHVMPRCDVILMRNVLYYLDETIKQRVVQNAARQLRPGGYLILGSVEQLYDPDNLFTQRSLSNCTVYERCSPSQTATYRAKESDHETRSYR